MHKTTKEFKVIAKSINTNSFGLHQMIVVSTDGSAYKTHASIYNAKNEGEIISQELTVSPEGRVVEEYFRGHEMTTKLPSVPEETLTEIFNL